MIDFWEAIGRLTTYKGLYNEFLRILPPVGMIPRVPGYVKAIHASGTGLDIPQRQYEVVQDFFTPILTENYLSLMAAGELIWAYSFQESRDAMNDLIGIVSQTTPQLYGPATRYFISLGILITDEIFRHNLRSQGPDAIKVIRRLSDPASEQLLKLAGDPKFDAAALNFCSRSWDGGCDSRLIYWPGHLHQLGLDSYDWKGDGKPADDDWEKVTAGSH